MILMFGWILTALVPYTVAGGGTTESIVPPAEARRCAERGVEASPAMFVTRFRQALQGASPAEPLLVKRLDTAGSAYYLVPFRKGGATTLVAMIEAASCRFLEATYLQVPSVYPPVSAEDAKQRVLASALGSADRAEIENESPDLVWQVCEWSQSPYEPLWRFRVGQGFRYVDQTGAVHDRIEAPKLKGGGAPGCPPDKR
jgi:hypothetical protein